MEKVQQPFTMEKESLSKGTKTPLGHDAEIKTALSQIQKRLASLEEKISAVHPLQRGK